MTGKDTCYWFYMPIEPHSILLLGVPLSPWRDHSQMPFNTGPIFDPSSYSNHLRKKSEDQRFCRVEPCSKGTLAEVWACSSTYYILSQQCCVAIHRKIGPTMGRRLGSPVMQSKVHSPLRSQGTVSIRWFMLINYATKSLWIREYHNSVGQQWQLPEIDHISVPVPPPAPTPSRRYPERQCHPPVHYGT